MALRIHDAGFPLTVFDTNTDAAAPFRERNVRVRQSPTRARSPIIPRLSSPASIPDHRGQPGGGAGRRWDRARQGGARSRSMSRLPPSARRPSAGLPRACWRPSSVSLMPRSAAASWRRAQGHAVHHGVRGVGGAGTGAPRDVGVREAHLPCRREERPGAGRKLINNMLSAAGKIAAFEGVVMGVKAGLDAQLLIDILNVSTGRNRRRWTNFRRASCPGNSRPTAAWQSA